MVGPTKVEWVLGWVLNRYKGWGWVEQNYHVSSVKRRSVKSYSAIRHSVK